MRSTFSGFSMVLPSSPRVTVSEKPTERRIVELDGVRHTQTQTGLDYGTKYITGLLRRNNLEPTAKLQGPMHRPAVLDETRNLVLNLTGLFGNDEGDCGQG